VPVIPWSFHHRQLGTTGWHELDDAPDLTCQDGIRGYSMRRTPGGALPVRPDAMSKRFTALAGRLGHGYTLYGLRHFMASQLGAVGNGRYGVGPDGARALR
jgi:hypothetical protein